MTIENVFLEIQKNNNIEKRSENNESLQTRSFNIEVEECQKDKIFEKKSSLFKNSLKILIIFMCCYLLYSFIGKQLFEEKIEDFLPFLINNQSF